MGEFINSLNNYKKKIKMIGEKGTEYSFRTYIQNLLEEYIKDKDIKVIQEPAKEKMGRPDFKVMRNEGVIGYIETKPLNSDLDKYIQSNQIMNYLK